MLVQHQMFDTLIPEMLFEIEQWLPKYQISLLRATCFHYKNTGIGDVRDVDFKSKTHLFQSARKDGCELISEWLVNIEEPYCKSIYMARRLRLSTAISAAARGDVDVLKVVSINSIDIILYNVAAVNGRINVLEWLWSKHVPYFTESIIKATIDGDQLDTLIWLTANINGCSLLNKKFVRYAANQGRDEIVRWFGGVEQEIE